MDARNTHYDSLGCSTLASLLIGVFCAAMFL
jgi:hypothetical protein